MNEQQLSDASIMWKAGMSMADIVANVGVTLCSFKHHARTKRDLFPERLSPWLRAKAGRATFKNTGDNMTWITHAGAKVTLPRISFLAERGQG